MNTARNNIGYSLTSYIKNKATINVSPGPTQIPRKVLEKLNLDLSEKTNNWEFGVTPLEISHRSPEFLDILNNLNASIRSFMKIPDDFSILWTQGGGHGQFSAVPLNMIGNNLKKATATNTGLDLTDEYYQTKKIKHDRSFILDLCRDTSQPHNVRFEAPNWEKKYMLSLKPLGLCALMCGNAGIDETNSLEILGSDMYTKLAKAVAHRSWWDNDRALKQLAYAIGFQDSDLNIYRRRSRIHVIAPSMEKEEK